jgi:hypothetical protein
MPGCPLGLPQASANVVDRPGGVAVELAAPAEEEVALRSRAENIAKAGGRGLIEACPCGARPGDMPYGGNRLGPGETSEVPRKDLVPPPADVQLEDTDAGVRLIFRAKDEHDVPALRHAVRTHVAQLTTGACGGM